MYKRKADLWTSEVHHDLCKFPKVDDAWTERDQASAELLNSMNLDARQHHKLEKKPIEIYYKCSRFIQALDLAGFDDWEFETDFKIVWGPLPPIVRLWFTLRDLEQGA